MMLNMHMYMYKFVLRVNHFIYGNSTYSTIQNLHPQNKFKINIYRPFFDVPV